MIYLKLFAAAIIIGSLYGNYYLTGKNGELEGALASTTAAFGEYAGNVEGEIEGYKVAQGALLSAYTENYDEKSRLENKLAKHDLGALAKSKPGLVGRRINSATVSLFKSTDNASRAKSAGATKPAKTETDIF